MIRHNVKAAKRKYKASPTFTTAPASPALVEKKVKISDIPKGLIGAITREPYPIIEPHAVYFNTSTYALRDNFLIDIRANTHVYNNRDRF